MRILLTLLLFIYLQKSQGQSCDHQMIFFDDVSTIRDGIPLVAQIYVEGSKVLMWQDLRSNFISVPESTFRLIRQYIIDNEEKYATNEQIVCGACYGAYIFIDTTLKFGYSLNTQELTNKYFENLYNLIPATIENIPVRTFINTAILYNESPDRHVEIMQQRSQEVHEQTFRKGEDYFYRAE